MLGAESGQSSADMQAKTKQARKSRQWRRLRAESDGQSKLPMFAGGLPDIDFLGEAAELGGQLITNLGNVI
jgi:hypothetical protein